MKSFRLDVFSCSCSVEGKSDKSRGISLELVYCQPTQTSDLYSRCWGKVWGSPQRGLGCSYFQGDLGGRGGASSGFLLVPLMAAAGFPLRGGCRPLLGSALRLQTPPQLSLVAIAAAVWFGLVLGLPLGCCLPQGWLEPVLTGGWQLGAPLAGGA